MAGKKYKASLANIDRDKFYGVEDAVKLIKAGAKAKFDETIEIALNLGIDPRHSDQNVRGVVNLPNGTGKTLRVAVFAKGSSTTGRGVAGRVTMAQCREIAEAKMKDLNAHTVDAATQMIVGSARSMGLEVAE